MKLLFQELILDEAMVLPLGGFMNAYDIIFLRAFLELGHTRVIKLGPMRMDGRFQRAMLESTNGFKFTRTVHLGVVSQSFWLS